MDKKIPRERQLPQDAANYSLGGCTDYNSIISDLQDEISQKFTPHKNSSEVLALSYYMNDLKSRFSRVLDCGSFLEFTISDTAKLSHANFCRDRLCPMCNWRRSLKIFHQVSACMDYLQDYQYIFLTLTIRNCPAEELSATIDNLYSGWRYLYNKNRYFRSLAKGTFRSLEVTRNSKTGDYHPHLHVLIAVSPSYFKSADYLSQSDFADIWQSALKIPYKPIVDVRKIRAGSHGIKSSVAEVSKYAVKSKDYLFPDDMDLSARVVIDFLSSLSGRRLCGFTGVFAKARNALGLTDPEDGDLVNLDGDLRSDVSDLIVRYRWRSGVYYKFGG